MKRRILKVWQFVLLLAMLMLIPQTMFFCFKRTKFVPIILLQPVYMGFLVLFAAVFFCVVFLDRFYQGLNRQKIFSAFCVKKYFLWECT